jgi:hypothetical protein
MSSRKKKDFEDETQTAIFRYYFSDLNKNSFGRPDLARFVPKLLYFLFIYMR